MPEGVCERDSCFPGTYLLLDYLLVLHSTEWGDRRLLTLLLGASAHAAGPGGSCGEEVHVAVTRRDGTVQKHDLRDIFWNTSWYLLV